MVSSDSHMLTFHWKIAILNDINENILEEIVNSYHFDWNLLASNSVIFLS